MDAWISWFISSPMQLDFDDLTAILQHYCRNKTSPNFRRPFLTCWIPCCFKFLEFLVAEKPLQSCSTSRWCWTASWRIICFSRFTRYGRRIWSGSDDSRCMGATQLGRLGCGVWCRMKPLVGWSCSLSFFQVELNTCEIVRNPLCRWWFNRTKGSLCIHVCDIHISWCTTSFYESHLSQARSIGQWSPLFRLLWAMLPVHTNFHTFRLFFGICFSSQKPTFTFKRNWNIPWNPIPKR